MNKSPRCLYHSNLAAFSNADENVVFGILCDNYHGDALTTTREAWKSELSLLKQVLAPYQNEAGQIILEYDIEAVTRSADSSSKVQSKVQKMHFGFVSLYCFLYITRLKTDGKQKSP